MKKDKTIYQRYGGQQTLERVMNRFFIYAINDKQIGPYYVENINDFGMHYRQFIYAIGQLIGGPSFGYRQRMGQKHSNIVIKQKQFDVVWQYLSISFYEERFSQYDIDQIRKSIYGVKGDVISKKQLSKQQIKKRQKIQSRKKKFLQYLQLQKLQQLKKQKTQETQDNRDNQKFIKDK